MTTKKVILLKTNLKNYDTRLKKEIKTLKDNGYHIVLLCWDRESGTSLPIYRKIDDKYEEAIFKFKAPRGPLVLPYLPFWWFFAFCFLLKSQSNLIHAINFDSIIPAFFACKIKRDILIYELFDIYEDHISMPQILREFFLFIDKIFMRGSNAIIIVDESRIDEVNGIPNDKIITIYNSPPDNYPEVASEDQECNSKFVIFYAGLLEKNRSLENMIDAVSKLEDVKLVVAGFGSLEDQIKCSSEKNPEKIQFIGAIEYKGVLNWSNSSNLLFSLYDPSVPLNRFASSNKLFEAMMCGKPILVSEGTSMADIVRRWDCGIVVNCRDIYDIQKAILKLKNDPARSKKLGTNGRTAYEKVYNWSIMEQKLINAYCKIMKVHDNK